MGYGSLAGHFWRTRVGLVALLLTLGAMASASAAAPSAADIAAVQNFRLSTGLLHRMETFQEAEARHPCALNPLLVLKDADGKSLNQIVAEYDARPGVHAALERNGLTARELLLGMFNLMGAGVQQLAQEHPGMVKNGEIQSGFEVSPQNMAFYRAHKDEIIRHSRQIGQEMLKRNDGHVPSCLMKPE